MKLAQSSKLKAQRLFLVFGLGIVLAVTGLYCYARPKYVVPVLMYHHIDERGEVSSLSVSPENFRRQMRFLSEHNYNVISLAELVQAKLEKKRLAPNTVVLTFDDGYEDNYLLAYPVLKKYSLPAIIFVIADSIDGEGYLNYQQIKEMASSGIIDIGSHTLSGAYLPGRSRGELGREICLSKKTLEANLNSRIKFFCYPIGGFSPGIQEIVKRCAYAAACTTNRGKAKNHLNNDLFALKRIKVKDSFPNLFVFRVKLSGYYNLFRRVREPH